MSTTLQKDGWDMSQLIGWSLLRTRQKYGKFPELFPELRGSLCRSPGPLSGGTCSLLSDRFGALQGTRPSTEAHRPPVSLSRILYVRCTPLVFHCGLHDPSKHPQTQSGQDHRAQPEPPAANACAQLPGHPQTQGPWLPALGPNRLKPASPGAALGRGRGQGVTGFSMLVCHS